MKLSYHLTEEKLTNSPSSAKERRLCAEERKKAKAKENEQKLVERNCDQEAQREKNNDEDNNEDTKQESTHRKP